MEEHPDEQNDADAPPHNAGEHAADSSAPMGDPIEHAIDDRDDVATMQRIDREEGREDEVASEMGFFEHLEELRWRIIKAVIALVVAAIGVAFFIDFIMQEVLLGPINSLPERPVLQNTEVMGQVTLTIQVALICGLIVAIPFILWQFWAFIRPGLYPNERKYARVIAVATIVCFLTGVAFAYFIMVPTSLGFMMGWVYEGIENRPTIASYFSFILGFILASGVIFEMPMLSYALSRLGILTPAFLRHYRRHAVVVIMILAAVITPTPDPFNMMLLAIPLYALFELSIVISRLANRQRAEALEQDNDPSTLERPERRFGR